MSQYGYVSSSHSSVDMSSYVAVTGKPEANHCSVFGLTPQELRYLKEKFNQIRRNGENGISLNGYTIEASPLVILNALGFIGFKVAGVAGTFQEYLWTLERNLDGMPELPHYTETGRQAHSSMNNISQLMQHTLEVPSIGNLKRGSGSSLSLVSDNRDQSGGRNKAKKCEKKKKDERRHSLSTSLNRLFNS